MTQHRHGAILFGDVTGVAAGPPDMQFCHVEDFDFNADPERTLQRCAGEIVPGLSTIDQISPVLRFTVKDLEELLKLDGIPCGNLVADIDAYAREVGDGYKPDAAASTTHEAFDIHQALVYWPQMTLSANRDATANVVCDIYHDPDGVPTEPFEQDAGVALPTVSSPNGHRIFQLSKVFLDGTQIPRVMEVSVANDITFDTDVPATTEFRELFSVNSAVTRITVKTKDRFNWTATGISFNGDDLDGVNGLEFYARQKGFATTASKHILFQALTGRVFPVSTTGSDSPMVDEFVVEIVDPSSPLTGTADQAIP